MKSTSGVLLWTCQHRAYSLQRTLATDELSRAERFHFQKDRQLFIVARGLLRAILSRYLD